MYLKKKNYVHFMQLYAALCLCECLPSLSWSNGLIVTNWGLVREGCSVLDDLLICCIKSMCIRSKYVH